MRPTKLDELRQLLFGPEHEKLEQISSRVEQTELRASDVAEVLPESIGESFRRDSRLINALRTPIRHCVAESVRESPDEYADALFPVMGPAIRRAVAEAFKGWIQQANRAIEQSLSPRGLYWRTQAWRAGIPFGQYVLQQTLLYRVEHVYLIHSGSGLLIAHVQKGGADLKDEDAVSAMFAAIQEFVQDSFSRTEPQRLRTAELGDLVLWAVHGPSCILVAVIRGSPPESLRVDLEQALERIDTEHSPALRRYAGDRASMVKLEPVLEKCLLASSRSESRAASKRRFSPLLVAAALAFVAVTVFLGYELSMSARARDAVAVLNATPGIVVTDFERDGRTLVLHGLRDPSASSVADLVAKTSWTGAIEAPLRPFLSLDREIVLARARRQLAPADSVSFELDAGTLRVGGVAPRQWIEAAASANVVGVDSIDLSGVAAEPAAPLDQATSRDIDSETMRAIEMRVASTVVDYAQGSSSAAAEERAKIDGLAEDLRRYVALAAASGLVVRVIVTGHSAANGPQGLNIEFERARAADAAAVLRAAGLPADAIVERSLLASGLEGARAPQVSLRLESSAQPLAAQH